MAFRYEPADKSAYNQETGEALLRTYTYLDIGGVWLYAFEKPGEPRIDVCLSFSKAKAAGQEVSKTACIVGYEKDLLNGFRKAYPNASEADWDRFKNTITDALFQIGSKGGAKLNESPDFRVEWEQDLPDT